MQPLSPANQKVRRLRKLVSSAAERADTGLFVVEGPVLCDEARRTGIEFLDEFVREGDEDHEHFVDGVSVLDEKLFDSVAPTDSPRSPLAVCRIPSTVDLSCVDGWILVADGISDPGNLGTIIRSAEAAGASCVVVTKGTTDPWSPKCVRASAGALFHVPVVKVASLVDVTRAGFEAVGTTSHADATDATDLREADLGGRVALVFGNEAHGLSADAPVARWITVVHEGRSESLNVAMAATVVALHVGSVRRSSRS